MKTLSKEELERGNEKRRRSWAKQALKYDKSIGFFERRVFGTDHRSWACSRAEGEVLEVAIGTGLNIPLYDPSVHLVGIDLSTEMLDIARKRAVELNRPIELREGDAHALPFTDAAFDAVVATYALCNIPDPLRAVGEMKRVLRPCGRIILVDHIRSAVKPVFWLQRAIELVTVRVDGDHMTRRSVSHLKAHGFEITERERLGPTGVVERLVAVKHEPSNSAL
jgi:ubiquinone/menaquinone biosynthesis C-methylase UbiE